MKKENNISYDEDFIDPNDIDLEDSEYCICDSVDYDDGFCVNCGKPIDV